MFYTNDPYFQVKEHIIPLKGLDKGEDDEKTTCFNAFIVMRVVHSLQRQ